MENELLIIFLLIINLLATGVIFIALFFNPERLSIWYGWLKVSIMLLFKKKIQVFPKVDHYSPNQNSEEFYLLKVIKCSHQRFFKVISGRYVTIIPESDIIEFKKA